jgi:hypothetical protein
LEEDYSCCPPLIVMMQDHDFRGLPHTSEFGRVDWTHQRGVHIQDPMRAIGVVVIKIRLQDALEVPFLRNDHVIKHLAANAADEPYDVRILPRRPRGDQDFLNAYVADLLSEWRPIYVIAAPQEITRRRMPTEYLHHLLRGPLGGEA